MGLIGSYSNRSTQYISTTSTGASVTTIAVPAGTQTGDLLILYFGGASTTTPALPTNFTLLVSDAATFAHRVYVAYWIVTGAPPATITVTSVTASAYTLTAFRFAGVPVISTAVTTNSTTVLPNPPSVTTATGGAILALGFIDTTAYTLTAGAGYTLGVSAGAGCTVATEYLLIAGAGTYDPPAFGGTITTATGTQAWTIRIPSA